MKTMGHLSLGEKLLRPGIGLAHPSLTPPDRFHDRDIFPGHREAVVMVNSKDTRSVAGLCSLLSLLSSV